MIYFVGFGTVIGGILIVLGIMLAYALLIDPKDTYNEFKKCIKEANERKSNESKN
jgi:hypothetical protein